MSEIHRVPSAAAMSLEGTEFAFSKGRRAVAGVTARVESGRLTAILGSNGAGKSVLLSLMAGLRRPTAGRVLLGDVPLSSLPPVAVARRVAWVPHQGQGGEALCVREMVELGRVAFGEARAQTAAAARRAIDFLELAELAGEPVGALSAGQRRRAMIARAVAQLDGASGAVLLLDEPDANLDPAQAVFLFRKLRLLAEAGMAVVAVVHDLHLATEFAEEAWLMREGCLQDAGSAQAALTPENLTRAYGVAIVPGAGLRVG